MSSRDWEVGPVLKDKAGSQGTLFRGGTKYSSPERFHRGYTPERLNEVKEVTRSTNPYYLSNESGTGPERRAMVDNIARSTVPMQHLQRLQFNPGQLHLNRGLEEQVGPNASVAGVYRREDRSGNWARLSMTKGAEGSPTLIHEIGHHVSAGGFDPDPDEHATPHSEYASLSQRGAEEGFADDYAFEHFRTKGGGKTWRQKLGTSEAKPIYANGLRGGDRTEEFYAAYHAQRGTQDEDWSRPSDFMRREAARKETDNASALIQKVEDTGLTEAKANPLAVPKGVDPSTIVDKKHGLRLR